MATHRRSASGARRGGNTVPHLELPSTRYKKSYIEAIIEAQAEGRYEDLDVEELERDFPAYVDDLLSRTQRNPSRPELVPETIWWLVEGSEFFGRVSIRHELNEELLRVGGHIGYDIRPSMRRKGYGTLILRLALEKARELGLDRVLLTCRADNVGSWKIIEANGGVLENEVEVDLPIGRVLARRYWIELTR